MDSGSGVNNNQQKWKMHIPGQLHKSKKLNQKNVQCISKQAN